MDIEHRTSLVPTCQTDLYDSGTKSVMETKRISWNEYQKRKMDETVSGASNKDTSTSTSLMESSSNTWFTNRLDPEVPLRNEDIQKALFSSDDAPSQFQNRKRRCLEPMESANKNSHEDEPVILTLSSDEEDEISDGNGADLIQNIEPIITSSLNMPLNACKEVQESEQSNKISMSCANVLIGNYKADVVDSVSISDSGIHFSFEAADMDITKRTVVIPVGAILTLLMCKQKRLIFVYLFPEMAKTVKEQSGVMSEDGLEYDPCSTDETKKRIIFSLLGNKRQWRQLRRMCKKQSSLGYKLAKCITGELAMRLFKMSTDHTSLAKKEYPCDSLLIYPRPPEKGRITLTSEDFKCLAKEEFLNDVIIDFYLKWLHHDKLPDFHRKRTHIFSTFFYKRLTSKPKKSHTPNHYEMDTTLTPAQRRHSRVKSWTKGIDIFEKDFLIIPINERSHWFLAVICFPGLDGPIWSSDGSKITSDKLPKNQSLRRSKREKRPTTPILDDGEFSDRDEAESEEDIDGFAEVFSNVHKPPKNKGTNQPSIKQPCILIFDSLPGLSRGKIVATIRQYLTVEYKEKKGMDKVFTATNMVGAMPVVPQQMNYSDCGTYVLQFADSFFEHPIKNYNMPIRSLREWFSQKVAVGKREAIANLIKQLMERDNEHKIPSIEFPQYDPNSDLEKTSQNGDSDSTSQGQDLSLDPTEFQPIKSTEVVKQKKISVNISTKSLNTQQKCKQNRKTSQSMQLIMDSYKTSDNADDDLYDDLEKSSNNSSNSDHNETVLEESLKKRQRQSLPDMQPINHNSNSENKSHKTYSSWSFLQAKSKRKKAKLALEVSENFNSKS